jgi:hypothetical protein
MKKMAEKALTRRTPGAKEGFARLTGRSRIIEGGTVAATLRDR